MSAGGGELVTTDEPAVVAKLLLDSIVVENSQRNGGLADSASADESDWDEVLSKIDYLLDQLVASKEGPWGQRRGFSRCARFKYKMMGASAVKVSHLV